MMVAANEQHGLRPLGLDLLWSWVVQVSCCDARHSTAIADVMLFEGVTLHCMAAVEFTNHQIRHVSGLSTENRGGALQAVKLVAVTKNCSSTGVCVMPSELVQRRHSWGSVVPRGSKLASSTSITADASSSAHQELLQFFYVKQA